MSKYLIKLTPHSTFFFGGEKTFGENNTNYFVKSEYFPQQTTLLGMVRYQLLVQSGDAIFKNNKIQNKDEVTSLIGEQSFTIGNDFNFGLIEKLSPVFISDKDNEFLFPANKEYQWIDKEINENGVEKEINNFRLKEFYKNENGAGNFPNLKDFIPVMKGYDPKKDLPDLLVNKDLTIKKYYDFNKDKNEAEKENGIFIEQKQVGIRKNYEGKSDDKSFFVQILRKLKKGYSFAFILELKNLELKNGTKFNNNNVVTLGADQSKFKMEVTKNYERNFDDLIPNYEKSKNSDKIILVSDAYVSNKILKVSDFAITETVKFRSLKSNVKETKKYTALSSNDNEALSKTQTYIFFKRGSVFYGNTEEIGKKINNDVLQKIGYNIYKTI